MNETVAEQRAGRSHANNYFNGLGAISVKTVVRRVKLDVKMG